MARFLTLLAVLGTTLKVHATPTEAAAAAKSSYCANFDDLPQNAAGFDPTVDPVGTYKGIHDCALLQKKNAVADRRSIGITYLGFVVATQKNYAEGQYFKLPSPPNVINSGTSSQDLYGGSPALQINTTATGGAKDTFTLTSLRLACLDTSAADVSNVNGCTVLFVGNKPSGAPSVIYEYEYPNQDTSGTGTLATFGSVTFPNNFHGLSEVFISLTAVQNAVGGVIPLLDDVCLSIQGS